MSKLHHVHVYTTIRVKVAVTADDHTHAMRQADDVIGKGRFPVRLLPYAAGVLEAEPAEEVTGYLVDEADDPDFENSCFYDECYQSHEGPASKHQVDKGKGEGGGRS
ncbi:hypothetical protein DFR49_0718 [Hephaestia caeni]|uniref:Uncharacterized protein n=1 Tax=Hephaestia caeni TaxID=645617 RepID=A0A397PG17_9SPHN|nr:hypothetical protein [Hephaestia caeni]RIA46185.1 hypothetical protein DFR49_0718 [Hephaestia caeni]